MNKVKGTKGLALGKGKRVLAGLALAGLLFALLAEGGWRWLALPCLAALFLLVSRRIRHLEQALQRSKQDYRQLIDLPVQATYIADDKGLLLHISSRWEEWTGLDFATTSRISWIEAIHPDQRSQTKKAWAEALTTGQ